MYFVRKPFHTLLNPDSIIGTSEYAIFPDPPESNTLSYLS
jgi:hypothetical protein